MLERKQTVISHWQNTSTAFGEGQGCNFRVRAAAVGVSLETLNERVHALSRLIDHVDLECLPFFKENPSSLENIAHFLWGESQRELLWVEVQDERGLGAKWDGTCELTLTFRTRTLRRVLDIEIAIRGDLNSHGQLIDKSDLQQLIARHFDLGRGGLAEERKCLEVFFEKLSQEVLPRRLIRLSVRDTIQKNVVFELQSNDTSLDSWRSLPPNQLQPEC